MIAVFAAFREEVRDYLAAGRFEAAGRDRGLRFHLSERVPGVVVTEGCFGNERAREAVGLTVERYKPDVVVSAGFAGAVRDGIEPGDLYLCERLMCLEGSAALWGLDSPKESPRPDEGVLRRLIRTEVGGLRAAGCMTLPQLASGSSMKRWVGENYPVSLVDMESYWASEAARRKGIPFLAVRAVLDPVGQTLPPFVSGAADSPAGLWPRALGYLATSPGDAPRLLSLWSQARAARGALADFLLRMVST